ncbi:MAG: class I SAM-dependent methyltransferase [Pseudomonadota bacterium]
MTAQSDHAALMDATYRYQRLIYDATRVFFLFGRNRLIAEMDVPNGGSVLEIACGTGRNLARIGRRYPGSVLHGIDISSEMLRTARAKLGPAVPLGKGDARCFAAPALVGSGTFDRIVLSYAVSMIPDWSRAVDSALDHLAPGGSLHVVDFGDQAGYPDLLRRATTAWIAKFHVTQRADFDAVIRNAAARYGCTAEVHSWYRGYVWAAVIRKQAAWRSPDLEEQSPNKERRDLKGSNPKKDPTPPAGPKS